MIYQVKAESVVNGDNYSDEIVTTDLKRAYEFIVNHNNPHVILNVGLWDEKGEQKGRRNNVVSMITKYTQAMPLSSDLVILVYVLSCSLGSAMDFLEAEKNNSYN